MVDFAPPLFWGGENLTGITSTVWAEPGLFERVESGISSVPGCGWGPRVKTQVRRVVVLGVRPRRGFQAVCLSGHVCIVLTSIEAVITGQAETPPLLGGVDH